MKERVFIQTEEYYEPYDKWFENNMFPSENGITLFFWILLIVKNGI
jgi:hypothetical protein